MPTATLTTATLETVGRPKPSKYEGKPDYRPCLFVLPDGSQRWKSYNEGSPELDWLQRGQTYQATLTGDDLTIIQPTDAPAPPTAPTATGGTIPDSKKPQIAAYATDMAKLYAYCYSQAKATMEPHEAPLEAVQAAASSVFIAASRKFNL